jgi:hypothetical protein
MGIAGLKPHQYDYNMPPIFDDYGDENNFV